MSVVIIFLDAARFLAEAVESVLAQRYPHWELLLVDDGSTDGSTDIARRYESSHPNRIRYLEHAGHANRGMSASRNLGVYHALGTLVAFLDADDVWLPHKLAEQVPLLLQHPEAAMLYGRSQFWFSWTGDPADADRDCLTRDAIPFDQLVSPPLLLTRFIEDGGVHPCTCSVLVRRSVFDEIGAFEEQFRNANEDMVFYTKVFLKAPVYTASQCWDRYRIHPESFWAKTRRERREAGMDEKLCPDRWTYLEWVEAYLAEHQLDVPEVRGALDAALWHYRHPRLHRLRRRLAPHLRRTRRGGFLVGRYVVPAAVRRRLRRRLDLRQERAGRGYA